MIEDSTQRGNDQSIGTKEKRGLSDSLCVKSSPNADRRSFLALVGVAVGTGAVGSVAADDQGDDEAGTSEDEDEIDGGEAERPPGTDALLGYIEARYGDRLDEDQRAEVAEQIAGSLESAAVIGEVDLENGDEPAFRFSAYRGDES
jgi:hypothetical protein